MESLASFCWDMASFNLYAPKFMSESFAISSRLSVGRSSPRVPFIVWWLSWWESRSTTSESQSWRFTILRANACSSTPKTSGNWKVIRGLARIVALINVWGQARNHPLLVTWGRNSDWVALLGRQPRDLKWFAEAIWIRRIWQIGFA